jgi:hypothetical protein
VDHTCEEVSSTRAGAEVDVGEPRDGEVEASEAQWQGWRGRGGGKVTRGRARWWQGQVMWREVERGCSRGEEWTRDR